MNGIEARPLPCFLEGEELPDGYYDVPDPYKDAPSCNVDLRVLSNYARGVDKKMVELTKEEVNQFSL